MTNNFLLNAPELKPHLQHIIEHPADPHYNSFILLGDLFAARLALEKLQRDFSKTYPQQEILFWEGYPLKEFLENSPLELLAHFHQLHPNLRCVIVANVTDELLTQAEQGKLGIFLKNLTQHGVQVAASLGLTVRQGYLNSSPTHPELWSWYMSGRTYTLAYGQVIYKRDLTDALTLAQDQKRSKFLARLTDTVRPGQLFAGILSSETVPEFSPAMDADIIIGWMGAFCPPASIFPRAVCPVCGKAKMICYSCHASGLSGGHVLKFYCLRCQERIAANNVPDYFQLIRQYGARPCYRKNRKRGV